MQPAHDASRADDPVANCSPAANPSLGTLLARALRLRCAACGQGRLFRNWIQVHPHCGNCGFHFERGPGYWLGSIYVNYGLTALIVTGGYFAIFFSDLLTPQHTLFLLTAFCLLFPLWFFRYARAIWLALDSYFDPPRAEEFTPQRGEPDQP